MIVLMDVWTVTMLVLYLYFVFYFIKVTGLTGAPMIGVVKLVNQTLMRRLLKLEGEHVMETH